MDNNDGILVRETQCCLLCGSQGKLLYSGLRDRLFNAPGIWTLMKCPICQLIWLNPQPVPDEVEKLYSQYFTHQAVEISNSVRSSFRKRMKASILQSAYNYKLEDSNRLLGSILSRIGHYREIVSEEIRWLEASENGRLLDIGCGNGLFLSQMRLLGWEVTGVELDGEAAKVAHEKFGLEVFQGSLDDANFSEGYFDAITMNHVIEHVPHPIELLTEIRRVLKPGGKLVVATPNANSLGYKVFGEYWRGLEVPRHMFLFTPQTLRECADSAGLHVQDLWTTARSAPWMWATSSLIRQNGVVSGGSPKEVSFLMHLQGLAFQVKENGLRGPGEAGEEIVMVAKR